LRGFKTYAARRINEQRETPGVPVWQRTFYDHIIRDEKEWHAIQEYIVNNPAKWVEDGDNRINWS
jgi:putative transposase